MNMSFLEKLEKSRERKVKEIKWVGPSDKELKAFPPEMRKTFGDHLRLNQTGQISTKTKTYIIANGYPKAQEIFDDTLKPVHRLVFIEMKDAIYVLHAFTKTSAKVLRVTQDLIVKRYKMAVHASEQACGIIRR